uniref:Uncharacterized protein n=1 Tax=Arundo donax TaxID=35708 RepID=A0A0A8Y062_ARUDO
MPAIIGPKQMDNICDPSGTSAWFHTFTRVNTTQFDLIRPMPSRKLAHQNPSM